MKRSSTARSRKPFDRDFLRMERALPAREASSTGHARLTESPVTRPRLICGPGIAGNWAPYVPLFFMCLPLPVSAATGARAAAACHPRCKYRRCQPDASLGSRGPRAQAPATVTPSRSPHSRGKWDCVAVMAKIASKFIMLNFSLSLLWLPFAKAPSRHLG
jgi:hypothetical protein